MDMKNMIDTYQSKTLYEVLKNSLDYHFNNFSNLEKMGNPHNLKDGEKMESAIPKMKANTYIKFELQAYINQLRRLSFYIQNKEIKPPEDNELLEVWNDIMNKDGVINFLGNKWSSHRSIDYPRGETENLHLGILLNLEQTITMWGNGHMYVSIEKFEFYLYYYHPKAIKFIEWLFKDIKQ